MNPRDGSHLGLRVWESSSGAGRLSYAEVRGYRVAAGDPILASTAPSALSGLFREFESDCRAAGRRAVYFGLPPSALAALDPSGSRGRWHAGDLPVFALARWRDPLTHPPAIRSQARRARNQGVTVRRLESPPGPADPAGPALRACLRRWVEGQSLPPLSFVTTPFLFDPWPEQGVFIAERATPQGIVVEGFLTASLALFPGLWRMDAVGRAPDAPNGCAELLVSEAFRFAALQGHAHATLGLAPLSRRSEDSGKQSLHWMERFAEVVREVGAPGYSFAGLEAFKAKFKPEEWRPLYCVSGGGVLSVRDILAIARVFAGGSLSRYVFLSIAWRFKRYRRRNDTRNVPGSLPN